MTEEATVNLFPTLECARCQSPREHRSLGFQRSTGHHIYECTACHSTRGDRELQTYETVQPQAATVTQAVWRALPPLAGGKPTYTLRDDDQRFGEGIVWWSVDGWQTAGELYSLPAALAEAERLCNAVGADRSAVLGGVSDSASVVHNVPLTPEQRVEYVRSSVLGSSEQSSAPSGAQRSWLDRKLDDPGFREDFIEEMAKDDTPVYVSEGTARLMVLVYRDERACVFVATCPALHIASQGATAAEAETALAGAMALWIKHLPRPAEPHLTPAEPWECDASIADNVRAAFDRFKHAPGPIVRTTDCMRLALQEVVGPLVDALRGELREVCAQLHRYQHGQEIESDYLCKPALDMLSVTAERDALRAKVAELETREHPSWGKLRETALKREIRELATDECPKCGCVASEHNDYNGMVYRIANGWTYDAEGKMQGVFRTATLAALDMERTPGGLSLGEAMSEALGIDPDSDEMVIVRNALSLMADRDTLRSRVAELESMRDISTKGHARLREAVHAALVKHEWQTAAQDPRGYDVAGALTSWSDSLPVNPISAVAEAEDRVEALTGERDAAVGHVRAVTSIGITLQANDPLARARDEARDWLAKLDAGKTAKGE